MIFICTNIFAVTSPDQSLYDYGALGIIVVVLSGFAYKALNILLHDRDKAVADRDVMIQDVFTKVLPAITRNTEVLQGRQEIDRQVLEHLKETNLRVEKNSKVFDEISFMLKHGQNSGRAGGA